MNVNTEPAERDEDSVSSDDGAEVLADWSSVEVAVGEAVSEPRFAVADASSVLVSTSGGEVVLV